VRSDIDPVRRSRAGARRCRAAAGWPAAALAPLAAAQRAVVLL